MWWRGLTHPFVLPLLVGAPPVIVLDFISHAIYRGGADVRAGAFWTFVSCLITLILGGSGGLLLVNRSSLLTMYAARTSRAYLGASNVYRHATEEGADVTTTQADDDISFHRYRPDLTGGPLHLINVFANESIERASQRRIRDRQGENMAVGPCGISLGASSHAVWVASAKFGDIQGRLQAIDVRELPDPRVPRIDGQQEGSAVVQTDAMSLSEWVAISGAALSPGRGAETHLGTSLVFGLSNLRLGYWWDSGIEDGQRDGEPVPTVLQALGRLVTRTFRTQALLLSEFTGRVTGPWRRFWYLSDGGNADNLGAYELIRRRVPVIICSDASRDSDGHLVALSNLMRKVRIDFGADIQFLSATELDGLVSKQSAGSGNTAGGLPRTVRDSLGTLDDLRLVQNGRCHTHAALARVLYEGAPLRQSVLLYIKATVTGDEPADVLEYQLTNPDFPHQSTIDQFFDEAQWESYRELGRHCATPLVSAGGFAWLTDVLDALVSHPT